jgi:hypothetical protein
VQSPGGDIPLGAGTYHIPTDDECEKCHRGRTEHILGFEEVELGLPGATGITLADLVARGPTDDPAPDQPDHRRRRHRGGGAGAGLAARQLRHHLPQRQLQSHRLPLGLRFRLDATQLDGRSSADFDARRTGVGVAVNAPNWKGQVRIVPGDPDAACSTSLISHRGPRACRCPPSPPGWWTRPNVALVRRWISQMPALPRAGRRPVRTPSPTPARDAGIDAAPRVMEAPDVTPRPPAMPDRRPPAPSPTGDRCGPRTRPSDDRRAGRGAQTCPLAD